MKNLLKDTIFIIIFILLLHIFSNIFVLKGNGIGSDVISFYNEKKNSLDIIFFGSSHSYATFSPEIIKAETGLDSYNFATQRQPIYISYHYMKEALKTQHPKFFVVEVNLLTYDDDYTEEGVVRDALDKMKFSLNKIEAINASVENFEERIAYYFNIIKYHTRYNELTKNDFITAITQKGLNNKGFRYLDAKDDIIINNDSILKEQGETKISDKNFEYLEKIVKLAKDNNIELILVKSPCKSSSTKQKYYNWIQSYADSNNIDFINYTKQIKELNLGSGDFYDTGHLSGIGAEKVSKNFSNYIKNKA